MIARFRSRNNWWRPAPGARSDSRQQGCSDLRRAYLGTLQHTAVLDPPAIENVAQLQQVLLSGAEPTRFEPERSGSSSVSRAADWLASFEESMLIESNGTFVESPGGRGTGRELASLGLTVDQLLRSARASWEPAEAARSIIAGFDSPESATAWEERFKPTYRETMAGAAFQAERGGPVVGCRT